MRYLKLSTTVTVQVGPFLAPDDGVTPKTGVSPTVYLSKAGAAQAARNSATAITHDRDGWYRVELNTTDTNTVGPLLIQVTDAATHLAVWHEVVVLPANVYDSLVGGTDLLQVDTTQIEGADATDTINAQADQALADYDAPTKAEMDAGFAALNDLSAAEVNAEVDQALVDINLDHLVGTATGIPAVPAGTFLDQIMDDGTASYDRTTDSLQALRDRGDAAWATGTTPPTAAAIADAVWDESLAGHLGAGSTGEALNAAGSAGDPWTTTLPGAYTGSQAGKVLADVLVDTADMQPKLGTPASTLAADIDALPTAAENATAVWAAGTRTLTSFGSLVSDIWSGITSAAMNKIADHVLRRRMSNVEASSDGDTVVAADSLYGMTQQHRQSDTTTNVGKLTIFETDGATELEQLDLATDPAADPVTGIS